MTKPSFERFELDNVNGGKVLFTASTDIVDYFEPARAFGESDLVPEDALGRFQARVAAVPDRRVGAASPMVFTIGNQRTFHLVRRTSEAGSGWERIDLHTAFQTEARPRARVEAFGVDWTEDDRFTLIVAIRPDAGSLATRILVADGLSSETTDFSAIAWVDWGERDVQVQGIRVLRRADESWLAVLCGTEGPRGQSYLLQSRQAEAKEGQPKGQLFREAIQFDTGITLTEILHFELGAYVDDSEAIHCLGKDRHGVNGLQSRAIPEFDSLGRAQTSPSVSLWTCPAHANALALGAAGPDGADLYIGGDGVHVIPAAAFDYSDPDPEVVIAPELAAGVRRVIVAETAQGDATVWALDRKGTLHYAVRQGHKGRWSAPLSIRAGVAEVAPVRGDDHVISSVLLVYTAGRAGHLWRDAQQEGTWHEAEICLTDPDGGENITCFGTNFRILTENRTPRAGLPVTLSASVLSNLVVNGRSVLVGPDLPVDVVTADDGSISLFNRATSFTPALYRIEPSNVAQAIDLSPSANMFRRFASLTADELRAAKIKGETPLLPETLRGGDGKGKVEAFVSALKQAAALAPAGNSGIAGISFVAPGAPFSDAIEMASTPDNFSLRIEAGKDGLTVGPGGTLPAATAVAGIFGGIGESLADFLESGWGKIKRGATYFIAKVADGYKLVCEMAGAVKEFVISKFEQIGKLFEGLWEMVVEAADKVWDYLKFLFDWEDVIVVRNIITNAVRQRITLARRDINRTKGDVSTAFTTMRESIQALAREMGVDTFTKLPSPTELSAANKLATSVPANPDVEAAQNNSVMSWFSNQLSSFFSQIMTIELPEDADTSPVPDVELGTILTSFELGWNALKDDLKAVIGPDFEIGDLNLETIKRIIVAIALRLADTALSAVEVLVLKVLEIVEKLMAFLDKALFSKIRFPFLEKLIKFISGREVDTSFRLIDVLATLAAIPTTLIYKVVTGTRPIKELQTWTYPTGNRVVAQGTTDDTLVRKTAWSTTLKISAAVLNTALTGYIIFANNKMLSKGPSGGSYGSYGRLFQLKDLGSAGLMFCTNVLGEGWEAVSTKSKNIAVPICRGLLSTLSLFQVGLKVHKLQQGRASFYGKLAETGGSYRIPSEEKFQSSIDGAALDLGFCTTYAILRTILFVASDKTAQSSVDFAAGQSKYLSQILINLGTWKMQPKILAAGAVAAAVTLSVTIGGEIFIRAFPNPAPA